MAEILKKTEILTTIVNGPCVEKTSGLQFFESKNLP